MKEFKTMIAIVSCGLLVFIAWCGYTLTSNPVNNKPIAEQHIDTSVIECWDGGFSDGNIRMVGAWVKGYKGNTVLIEDETGNTWMMDDYYIDKDEFLLLWLADNHTPDKTTDDIIIKVWREAY